MISLILSAPAWAQRTDQLQGELAAFQVTERLGARVPAEAAFTTDEGQMLSLSELSGKTPVLLTLNYVGCPMLCSLQLSGLARALKESERLRVGRDFQVLTVSIDPAEKRAKLERFKESQVRLAGGTAEVKAGWRFVFGPKSQIDAVAQAVGFGYRFDPSTSEFHHQATLVVLTPDLRVSSYLHGVGYEPKELERAVQRASRGEVYAATEQAGLSGFLMACFQYDPHRRASLGLWAVRAGGLVVLAGLVLLVSGSWRRFAKPSRESMG